MLCPRLSNTPPRLLQVSTRQRTQAHRRSTRISTRVRRCRHQKSHQPRAHAGTSGHSRPAACCPLSPVVRDPIGTRDSRLTGPRGSSFSPRNVAQARVCTSDGRHPPGGGGGQGDRYIRYILTYAARRRRGWGGNATQPCPRRTGKQIQWDFEAGKKFETIRTVESEFLLGILNVGIRKEDFPNPLDPIW